MEFLFPCIRGYEIWNVLQIRVVNYDTGNFCSVYPYPAMKWRNGICNFATHVKMEVQKDAAGRKINLLKAAKRASARH